MNHGVTAAISIGGKINLKLIFTGAEINFRAYRHRRFQRDLNSESNFL